MAWRASCMVASPARLAWIVSVVWRSVRVIWLAAGSTDRSTMAISGTVRPSGDRTMKVAMSSAL